MPPGPSNGTHKPGVHPTGYPMARAPLPPFHGGPQSQPYAIPTRGAVHGPVGAVPHVPPPGSRGFSAGRGNSSATAGNHLPHQQGTQQSLGNLGSTFNFPALENPNSQPSVGGPLSQPGFANNVCALLFPPSCYFLIPWPFAYWENSDYIFLAYFRCQSKGQVKHLEISFQQECPRYL